MDDDTNIGTVRRLFDGLNAKRVDVMGEVFTADCVVSWPQSGEVIHGSQDLLAVYRAMPLLPTITPGRVIAQGSLVVAEASLDYDGEAYLCVFLFELSDGHIERETGYWSKPFPPQPWRSQWVTLERS
jgi:hypothetical protein